jgi:predicted PurR-regulated permease PerM
MTRALIDKLPPSLQETLIPLMETLFKEQERFFSEMQQIHNAEVSQYLQQLDSLQQQFESASQEEQQVLLNQLQSAISSQLHYLLLQSLVRFLLFSILSRQHIFSNMHLEKERIISTKQFYGLFVCLFAVMR